MASRKPEYGKISTSDTRTWMQSYTTWCMHKASWCIWKIFRRLNRLPAHTVWIILRILRKKMEQRHKKWVLHERANLPHFAVHTNNHLENWFGRFNKLVSPGTTMAQFIETVIDCDIRAEQEYNFRRNRVGVHVNRSYDREMSQVLRFTTHFVAEHIEREYIQAMSKVNVYDYDVSRIPGCVVVKDQYSNHTVLKDTFDCSCAFASSMKLPCRHAIAYRKFTKAEWCIPLSRIHQRWMKSADEEKVKQQFVYKPFSSLPSCQSKLSTREKYKEAVCALQVVCSELADIEDDAEYREHLEFVLSQWRNVRQRKRIRVIEPEMESTPFTSTNGKETNVARTTTQAGGGSESPDSDVECDDLVERVLEDKRVNVKSGALKQKDANSKVRIALNPHVVPSGRPPAVRTDVESKEKKKRTVFNASEQHRRRLGEIFLVELAISLDDEKPNLSETMKRIESLQTRFKELASSKPRYHRKLNPVLNANAFYLLPESLLERSLKLLPVSNNPTEAIVVDGASESSFTPKSAQFEGFHGDYSLGHSNKIEYITISEVGSFSRSQIEAMMNLTHLRSECQAGLKFCDWILRDVACTVSAPMQEIVNQVAENVASMYPRAPIVGLTHHCQYKTLYQLQPPTMADGALIVAFCQQLQFEYPNVILAGIASARPYTKRGRRNVMDAHIKRAVFNVKTTEPTVLIPVNFNNAHWCGIVLNFNRSKIWLYDSMNNSGYKVALNQLSRDLVKELQVDFPVEESSSPLLFDCFSCGFFVCQKFLSLVRPSTSQRNVGNALLIQRFRILYYVLYGRHCEDAKEEELVVTL